jgi:hypothetical protein
VSEEKDSDASNLVTVDRRDLYDFVRGAIKDALEQFAAHVNCAAWLLLQATLWKERNDASR